MIASWAFAQQGSDLISNFSFETADPNNSSLAANWQCYGSCYSRVALMSAWDGSYVAQMMAGQGAVQHIVLNQSVHAPVRISAHSAGQNIADVSSDNLGASLDCKIHYHDGSDEWCWTTTKTKSVGTFDWKFVGYNTDDISSNRAPIDWIDVRLVMGNVSGTAQFDDVQVRQWTPEWNGLVTFRFDDSFASTYTKGYP